MDRGVADRLAADVRTTEMPEPRPEPAAVDWTAHRIAKRLANIFTLLLALARLGAIIQLPGEYFTVALVGSVVPLVITWAAWYVIVRLLIGVVHLVRRAAGRLAH